MLEKCELPTTQLEYTYRVKELKEYLDRNEIYLIALDVDNTLVDTGPYYQSHVYDIGLKIAPHIDSKKDPELISKEISELVWRTYREDNCKPSLIFDRYTTALSIYLGEEPSEALQSKIASHFAQFYLKSPPMYESTPRLINSVLATQRPIVFHSHAQKEWTEIKINKILKACGLDKLGVKLPFLGTPLEKDKDAESWSDAYSLANTHFGINILAENILNVGDNWDADIYPAFQAGCRNFVWINSPKRKVNITDNGDWVKNVNLVESKEVGSVIDDLVVESI
jgi:hypothetical protein